MSWNSNLWDSTGELFKYLNDSTADLDNLVYFFKEKSKIDAQYSKTVQKLINDLQKMSKKNESEEYNKENTFSALFRDLLLNHLYISNQAEMLSELSQRVSTNLKAVLIEFSAKNKALYAEVEKITAKKSQVIKEYNEQKKCVEARRQEEKSAQKLIDEPESTQFSIKINTNKAKLALKEKKEATEKALSLLKELSEECREMLRRFYFADLPEKLSSLEENNTLRINSSRDILINYLDDYKNRFMCIIDKSLNDMMNPLIELTGEMENSIIANSIFTGYLPPNHPDEEPKKVTESKIKESFKNIRKKTISLSSKLKSATINEPDDFSSLPPAKRMPAIQAHVISLIELSSNIRKEISASKKLLLTVPKYGGRIATIQSHYKSLEQRVNDYKRKIEHYSSLYVSLGGDITDITQYEDNRPKSGTKSEPSSISNISESNIHKNHSEPFIVHSASFHASSNFLTEEALSDVVEASYIITKCYTDESLQITFNERERVVLIETDQESGMSLVKSEQNPEIIGWIPSDNIESLSSEC